MSGDIRSRNMSEGPILKNILLFFFPILLGTFFQQLYTTVDSMIVGKFCGKEALAAVGSTGNLISLLVGFFVSVSGGSTVIISQHFGAGEADECSKAVHTAIALSLIGGLVLTVVGFFTARGFLILMRSPESIIDLAVEYVQIYYLGVIPSLIYNMGSSILRAVGDSRRPLYYLIICCIANIVLDLLFVAVFHLGVAGACIATILAETISAALVMGTLMRSKEMYRFYPRRTRIDMPSLRSIVRIGLPAGLQSPMYSIANIVIQTGVNILGVDAVAAYSAYGRLDGLFWMTINALGISVTTFVAQNYGAHKHDRLFKGIRSTILLSILMTTIIVAFMLPCGGFILSLFTDDSEVIRLGIQLIRWIMPFFCFYIPIEILGGSMRAVGDSWPAMIMTAVGVCVTRVLWIIFVLPRVNTLVCAAVCFPISWFLTACAFIIYYLGFSRLGLRRRRSGLI